MTETLTKTVKSQDAERAQEKKRQLESAPVFMKALAGESVPFEGLLGVSAMEPAMESHAALLGDSRFCHSANNTRKAGLVAELQGTYGNRYVQRLVESLNVQAKLTVGSPDDQYEREGDRVADTVTRASALSIQRQYPEEEEEEAPVQTKLTTDIQVQRQAEEPGKEEEEEAPIQTKLTTDIQVQRQAEASEEEEQGGPIQTEKAGGQTPLISSSLQSRINSLKGGGQPLPESTREYFEPRFGYDFSQVRVHTDSKAAETAKSINAKAFTIGKDVVFGAEQYSPATSTGKKLMAHELTHVVQQNGRQLLRVQPLETGEALHVASSFASDAKMKGGVETVTKGLSTFGADSDRLARCGLVQGKVISRAPIPPRPVMQSPQKRTTPSQSQTRGKHHSKVPDLTNWPDTLPKAVRTYRTRLRKGSTRFQGHNILKPWVKKRKPKRVIVQSQHTGEIDKVITHIAANRAAVKDHIGYAMLGPPFSKRYAAYYTRKGLVYKGKTPALPAAVKVNRINRIVWNELASEGGASAIQTSDNMIFTWGKGFGGWLQGKRGGEGNLGKVMKNLFKRSPAAKKLLWNAGVTYDTTWRVVDIENKWIETGKNALKLLASDQRLLNLFVQLGEDKAYLQHTIDSQWDVMSKHAAKVPSAAHTWNNKAIALVAHLVHWLPSIPWSTYVHTQGNLKNIVRHYARRAANFKSLSRTLRNGARVILYQPIWHLRHMAKGVGFRALQSMARLEEVDRNVLENDQARRGHLLLTDSLPKNGPVRFYDIGK